MGNRRPGPALLEVVVPARNEAGRLPAGLDLLSDRLAALPARAEVIVVDNASTDGTAEIVRSWRGPVPVRLLTCERPGKGAAVRTGLLATRAPYIGFMDADMATDLEASRMLVYNAARLKDAGLPFAREAAMAKLFASEAANRITSQAVELFGGYGYSKEYPVEKLMRDTKLIQIYEGTSQVQRLVIARELLKGI